MAKITLTRSNLRIVICMLSVLASGAVHAFNICLDEKTKKRVFQDSPCYGLTTVRQSGDPSPKELAAAKAADQASARRWEETAKSQKAESDRAALQRDAPETKTSAPAETSEPARKDNSGRKRECEKLIQSAPTAARARAYAELCVKDLDDSAFNDCVRKIQSVTTAAQVGSVVSTCTGDISALARVAPPRPPPAEITNCDGGGCWGTDGQRYNRAGGGNFTRQDGKFCQKVGTQLQCN